MATTLEIGAYPAAASVTCTVTSLGNGNSRQSTAVDNSTNRYVDALLSGTFKTGTVSGTPTVSIFVYGVGDGGNYADGCTGSDASYTPVSPTNLVLAKVLNTPSSTTSYVVEPVSLASLFGGTLPQKWGVVVTNNTGAALDASIGGLSYVGIPYQNV